MPDGAVTLLPPAIRPDPGTPSVALFPFRDLDHSDRLGPVSAPCSAANESEQVGLADEGSLVAAPCKEKGRPKPPFRMVMCSGQNANDMPMLAMLFELPISSST